MNLLREWGDRVDAATDKLVPLGHKADDYVCQIIDLLTDIRAGITALNTDGDTYEYQRLVVPAGAANAKRLDGRQGYGRKITNIAIIAPAAADVDVFVMSADSAGFVQRWSLAAAGRTSQQVAIPVPEGQPVFVQSSIADVQVNLILERFSA